MLQSLCVHTLGQKKKEKKKDSQCFSCMCGVFCAGRADANGNMHVCCVSFIDVSYIYTLCFVLNSLKQLVLNLLKATTTEWEHGLAYVEKTLFLLYSWLFTCLGAQCHRVSVTFLPELISVSDQNKGKKVGIGTTNSDIAFVFCYKFYFSY